MISLSASACVVCVDVLDNTHIDHVKIRHLIGKCQINFNLERIEEREGKCGGGGNSGEATTTSIASQNIECPPHSQIGNEGSRKDLIFLLERV